MSGLPLTIIGAVFLLSLALISWFIPRRMGLIGVFIAHIAILMIWTLVVATSYEGFEQLVGLVIFVFVTNMVLLPVTITAFVFNIRERRARRAQEAK